MGMTMTEKILAAHAGLDAVRPGQLIHARLDLIMAHDVTAPVAIAEFKKYGFDSVADPDKIVLIMDHFAPNKDIKSANNCCVCRRFASEMGIEKFYDIGQMGICHGLIPEKGLALPGEAVIGGDSHTCTYGALGAFSTGVGSTDVAGGMVSGSTWFKVPATIRFNLWGKPGPMVGGKDIILYIIGLIGVSGALYKAMEFGGPGLRELGMDDRFTIANMAIEAGAKNGIFEVDDVTLAYVRGRADRPYTVYAPDPDAAYCQVIDLDLSQIGPMLAKPHIPSNVVPVAELREEIRIDQVYLGSCTNGRLSDLRIAADILRGKKVAPGVRVIVVPATQQVYLDALRAGYIEDLLLAGCAISTPTCGACAGGHMGILGAGERALSTTNRNFLGRMGAVASEVYLCGPAVAAASALRGCVMDPRERIEGGDRA